MSKQYTITLSDVQVEDIKKLVPHMREGDFATALVKCVDQGITQLTYRYKRNADQWNKAKENKVLLEMLLKERAERLKSDDDIVARD